ncbi:histidine triad (HIT) family protein [Mycoplasmoides fastidiosum]|uniref:Histidine triad (HIT) family protein n=1 Tax=Mycoplasmoides fastidiosum TaxID=92758 RepID=A0ABU0M063_9BACT|nr:HIT domain-containing protein [Mycoplasmoides fastidiosum]MDQ0514340.1 histidine triad (HIT) family protein [Mycoplasmoides fastidiosum]UUD38058.1 HIT domain-containing protein [Mycoplasmoides fastidiosum]
MNPTHHDSNCLFCKLVNHEIPSYQLLESEFGISILDIFPAAPGHALVLPKHHYPHLLATPDSVLADLTLLAKKTAQVLADTLVDIQGFNYVSNQAEIAGQTIFHTHIHIIPKYHQATGYLFQHHHDPKQTIDIPGIHQQLLEKIKSLKP